MSINDKVVDSDRIWACLIANDSYLPGLLTLAFSLRRVATKYPFVALHTGALSDATLRALAARDIPVQRVPHLRPEPPVPNGGANHHHHHHHHRDAGNGPAEKGIKDDADWYAADPRFRECFTKLAVFALTGYARVGLLDADMLVRRNMDELLRDGDDGIPLDDRDRLFAAAHACVCNPLGLDHYPRDFCPGNCVFGRQHADPEAAQVCGEPPRSDAGEAGLALLRAGRGRSGGEDGTGQGVQARDLLNSGLLVVKPSRALAGQIDAYLHSWRATPGRLPFPDQSLLSDLFAGRWVALPYVYNALKPMRAEGVHGAIWRDENVKNVHYILTPKPWDLWRAKDREEPQDKAIRNKDGNDDKASPAGHDSREPDELDEWWREADLARRRWEAERGLGRF